MIFNLKNPYQKQKFLDFVTKLVERERVVEIGEKHPKRTLKQNSYLHLIIDYFAATHGVSSIKAKCDIFKKECNPDLFYREVVNKDGETVRKLRSTSELNTAEMTLAINRFINRSVSFYEIPLPSPEDEDFLVECEQEVEANYEFLTIDVK